MTGFGDGDWLRWRQREETAATEIYSATAARGDDGGVQSGVKEISPSSMSSGAQRLMKNGTQVWPPVALTRLRNASLRARLWLSSISSACRRLRSKSPQAVTVHPRPACGRVGVGLLGPGPGRDVIDRHGS